MNGNSIGGGVSSFFTGWGSFLCSRSKAPMRIAGKALLLLTLFSLLTATTFGQTDTGSISGIVRDSTGAVVPAVKVSVRNIATSVERAVETDSAGVYTIPGLASGTYDVAASKAGFADYKVRAQITVGSFVTVNAQLSLSAVTSTIEVVAVEGTEINTQSQEVSQIISPDQIQNLPSLTRNPYDFVALAGNVSGGDRSVSSSNAQISGGSGQNGTDRGVGFSINGQRPSGTEVLLDGAENTNIFDTTIALLIPQDSVREYRLITNNFDAQYGRASGGVVSVVTKSGSNNFHGDAWEFNRLSAYTANTFDNNASATPKGQYTRNQFGYDVGGPVKKDKLFVYQSTEWTRVRSSASLLAYVPTPELVAATAQNVKDYFTAYGNQTFQFVSTVTKSALTGYTPASACTPTSAANCGAFDNAFPGAAGAATPIFGLVSFTAPADAGGDEPQNTYLLVARADYNFSDKTQMFFRFGRESLLALPGGVFNSPYSEYNEGQGIHNNNYLLSVSHTFTPNLLTSTKLSFFRDNEATSYNKSLQNTPTLFLYNNAVINKSQPLQLPGFSDFTTGTGGLPYGGPQNTVQINQDLTWTKGKHSMRYGGEFNYIQMNRGFGAYAQAVEQLGKNTGAGLDNMITGVLSNFTAAVNPAGKFSCFSGAYSGTTRGNLIVTPTCTVTPPLTAANFSRSDRYKDWALYAEDSWRVTQRFTFNYGVRYEHYGVQHNNDPSLDSNLYYGAGSNIFQQINTGSIMTVPTSPIGELWKPTWGTIGPRIGFAYDVFGDGKTALRGGYGISYERNFGNVTFNIIQNPPNNATVSVSNTPVSVSDLGPLAGGGGAGIPLPPVSPRNVSQNIQTAQTQFWGVTVERKLGSKSVVALEYNGAHGLHLYDIKNLNEIGGGQVYLGQALVTDGLTNPAEPNCLAASPCLTRPNQQFTSINNRGSGGYSHYNGLTVRYQTQELGATGFSILANYTRAYSKDNLSSTFSESSTGSNGVGNLGYLDPRNPSLDYGNSDFDIRNRFAFSGTWNEPFLKGSRGLLGQVAGGWSLSPIFTARSGTPFSISDSDSCLNCNTGPYGIPRYVPTTPISSFNTGSGVSAGANNFNLLTLPVANSFTGLLGVSDFGPYPADMTTRNEFYGPGAWTFDLAVTKSFPVTERLKLEFRAEGFNIFNHANMYFNGFNSDAANYSAAGPGKTPAPVVITGKKGGLGNSANNGNHDERRFGQFALRLLF
jgi:outer membrane receptor protein involved in Fe transport